MFWVVAGVVLAVLLRAPWFDNPLGIDEGGDALVARSLHHGAFPYGSYFLDRPPLLVVLYWAAGVAGPGGIRALGAVAAGLLVVFTTLLAIRLGGRRAAPWAAVMSAVLASSSALTAVFSPAELLAAVPSSASVLLLVIAIERSSRRLWLLAGAGALAAIALLVKQSFADALVAGAAVVLAGRVFGVGWRDSLKRAAAYGAGIGAVAVGLFAWELIAGVSTGSVWFALFGFRLDAVSALSSTGFGSRISRLGSPLLTSGLALGLAFAVLGIVVLRGRPLVRVALGAWIVAGVAGILLGGSYWHHYLIEIVPGVTAAAAAAFAQHRRIATLAVATMLVPAIALSGHALLADSADSNHIDSVIAGHYIHARALPGQTLYVMYAHANVLYYSGLRDPFPYNWSLMMRAAPHAQSRLRALLASPQRPTWVLQWQSHHAFGQDRNGMTKQLLTRHYRRVTTLCGRPLLLALGAGSRPAPHPDRHCTAVSTTPVSRQS